MGVYCFLIGFPLNCEFLLNSLLNEFCQMTSCTFCTFLICYWMQNSGNFQHFGVQNSNSHFVMHLFLNIVHFSLGYPRRLYFGLLYRFLMYRVMTSVTFFYL